MPSVKPRECLTQCPTRPRGVTTRTTEVSAERRESPAFNEQERMSTNKICSDDRAHTLQAGGAFPRLEENVFYLLFLSRNNHSMLPQLEEHL